ncbi:ABC transporter permease [Anaeromicropila herbilytica]|uniref:Transport permease protein n=1 Tax=Anaeromicropila herbilytica TaxID=2785025 RepID=A0A7R7ICE5_9FIRM|nr:ABC transporter permease [Anaeromicropila herbilytica]BCN29781.1 ABC transporter [Anaeromicropila herbilytica]
MNRVIKNFMKYRFLLVELVKKDIKLKYRKSVLGILWTLLEPILTTIVLYVVFSQLKSNEDNFAVYILTGRLLYTFFANSTKACVKSIRTNGSMIKKVYVPKYIYPLSSVLSNYITFLISLIVLVGTCAIFRLWPTKYILASIFPLVIILIMSFGFGLLLAAYAVFFRDLEYLWSVVLMMIMYASAIFYDVDKLIKGSKNAWVFRYNPLYAVIVNFRDAVYGRPIEKFYLAYSFLVAIVSLVLGIYVFYKKQDEFILNI